MRHITPAKILFCLSIVVPFILYSYTLAPTITFGDSGELITASYLLGIAHPPGFPFWILLSHVFTYIPFGSIAWRVNLSSALFSAISVGLLYYLIVRTARNLFNVKSLLLLHIPSFTGAMILAVSRPLWSQSISAEVYTLVLLLFVSQLLMLERWSSTKKDYYLYAFSLLAGLGLSTHYMILIVYPAYGIFILLVQPSLVKQYKKVLISIALFLLGMSFLLYIPIRVFSGADMNWGHMRSGTDIVEYLRRKQFGSGGYKYTDVNLGIYIPSGDIDSASSLVSKFFHTPVQSVRILNHVFTPLLLLIALLGLTTSTATVKKHTIWRSFIFLTMLCFLFSELLFDIVTIPSDFFLAPNMLFFDRLMAHTIISIWVGLAGIWTAKELNKRIRGAGVLVAVAFLTIPLYFGSIRFSEFNWRTNMVAYDHAVGALNAMDQNATLFIDKNDWLFPILYATKVERIRPDITLIDRTGNLFENVYNLSETPVRSPEELEAHRKSIDDRIIEAKQGSYYYAADKDFESFGYDVAQEGILYKHRSVPTRQIEFSTEYKPIMSIENIPWRDDDLKYIIAYYHMRYADQLLAENKKDEAVRELETALSLASDTYLTLNQLGTYFGMMEQYERAEQIYRKALAINPGSGTATRNLGITLALLDRKDEALDVLLHAAEIDPYSQTSHLRVAELYEQKNDMKNALVYYLRASNIAPNQTIHSKVVLLSVKTGDCQQAQDVVQKIPTSTQGIVIMINNIGVCWAQKEKYEKARVAWETALNIDPTYQAAQDNINKLPTSQ